MSCIVLPYYQDGSMADFDYRNTTNGIDILKSLLKSVFICMQKAFEVGVLHNDTHPRNILIVKTQTEELYGIKLFGYKPVFMDFENALSITPDKMNIGFVYKDFDRLLSGLRFENKVQLVNASFIGHVLETLGSKGVSFEEATPIIMKYIDDLTLNTIQTSRSYVYDPSVF